MLKRISNYRKIRKLCKELGYKPCDAEIEHLMWTLADELTAYTKVGVRYKHERNKPT
jgi:hypothetical protein